LFVNKQAAVTAGILPQVRWRRVPNKKRIAVIRLKILCSQSVCPRLKFIS